MEEKFNILIFLIHDIKRKVHCRMEYKDKFKAWKKNRDKQLDYWDGYPDHVPLEPIKDEIVMARRLLNELNKELTR